MKLLVFGDIMGRKGRELVVRFLPALRERYAPDFCIANTENLTQGRGPTADHLILLEELGFDIFTGGNHLFSHIDKLQAYLDRPDSPQIRPYNYFSHPDYPVPWRGYRIIEKPAGRLLVINLLGSVFMSDVVDNAFLSFDRIVSELQNREISYDALIVDYHRETTAELALMAEYVRWRASLLYGTHTHVQTNDARILPGGTGVITDIGMTGSENSAIGCTYASFLPQALTGTRVHADTPKVDMGSGVVCALYVEISGLHCTRIETIRLREDDPIAT